MHARLLLHHSSRVTDEQTLGHRTLERRARERRHHLGHGQPVLPLDLVQQRQRVKMPTAQLQELLPALAPSASNEGDALEQLVGKPAACRFGQSVNHGEPEVQGGYIARETAQHEASCGYKVNYERYSLSAAGQAALARPDAPLLLPAPEAHLIASQPW